VAVAVIVEAPGMTRESYLAWYRQTMAKMAAGGGHGLLFHSAGIVDGILVATDVWESREDFERFENEVVRPTMQVVGVGDPPATVRIVELFDIWAPDASRLGELGADPVPE
jgi:hypothetical protein